MLWYKVRQHRWYAFSFPALISVPAPNVYFLLSKSGDPNKLLFFHILATALQLWYASHMCTAHWCEGRCTVYSVNVHVPRIDRYDHIHRNTGKNLCKVVIRSCLIKTKLKRFDSFSIKLWNVKFNEVCLHGSCMFINVMTVADIHKL